MLIHLHSEQFDAYMHAQCGAGDWPRSGRAALRCVGEDAFEALPSARRCRKCSAYWFPNGEPDVMENRL